MVSLIDITLKEPHILFRKSGRIFRASVYWVGAERDGEGGERRRPLLLRHQQQGVQGRLDEGKRHSVNIPTSDWTETVSWLLTCTCLLSHLTRLDGHDLVIAVIQVLQFSIHLLSSSSIITYSMKAASSSKDVVNDFRPETRPSSVCTRK